jgi:hypothetical protein
MAPKKTPAAGPAAAAAAIPDTSLPERLRSGGSRPPSTAASKAASKGSKAASGASGTDIAAARRPAVDPWHEGTTYEHHCPACDARRGAIRHYNLIPITHPQTVIDAESELGKMLAEAYPGVDLSTYVCQGDTPSLKKVKLLKHEGLWEAMYYTMRVYTQWEIVEWAKLYRTEGEDRAKLQEKEDAIAVSLLCVPRPQPRPAAATRPAAAAPPNLIIVEDIDPVEVPHTAPPAVPRTVSADPVAPQRPAAANRVYVSMAPEARPGNDPTSPTSPSRPTAVGDRRGRDVEVVNIMPAANAASPGPEVKPPIRPVIGRDEPLNDREGRERALYSQEDMAEEYPLYADGKDAKMYQCKMVHGAVQTIHPLLHQPWSSKPFLTFLRDPQTNSVIRSVSCLKERASTIMEDKDLQGYYFDVKSYCWAETPTLNTMARKMLSELVALYCVATEPNTSIKLRGFLYIAQATRNSARLCNNLEKASQDVRSIVTVAVRSRLAGSFHGYVTKGLPSGLVTGEDFTTPDEFRCAAEDATLRVHEAPLAGPPLHRHDQPPPASRPRRDTPTSSSAPRFSSTIKLIPNPVISPSRLCRRCGRDGHRVNACTHPPHPHVKDNLCQQSDLVNMIANGWLPIPN